MEVEDLNQKLEKAINTQISQDNQLVAIQQQQTDLKLQYISHYENIIINTISNPSVVSFSRSVINRALNVHYSHEKMILLIPRVMQILTGVVAEPFIELMEAYRHAHTRYIEALGRLQAIFDLHSVNLIYAQEEGSVQFKSALERYQISLEEIPDLTEQRNRLEKSVDQLSKAIVLLGSSVSAKTSTLLENAGAILQDARREFEQAESNHKSNITAAVYFNQHKINREARMNFLKTRIKETQSRILEQNIKLKEAQQKEMKSSSQHSSGYNFLGIDLGTSSSKSDTINTDWTQRRCKERITELEKESSQLTQQLDALVNYNQNDETHIRKMEESFNSSYLHAKERLVKAEQNYWKIESQFVLEKLAASGINQATMIVMTEILLHLKTFALIALPNLSHINTLKGTVIGMLKDNNISARRIIASLKPLAEAYVEEEVLRQLVSSRTQRPELIKFITAMQTTKNSALEHDPEIAKGNPVNVDGFAREKTGPVIYPL